MDHLQQFKPHLGLGWAGKFKIPIWGFNWEGRGRQYLILGGSLCINIYTRNATLLFRLLPWVTSLSQEAGRLKPKIVARDEISRVVTLCRGRNLGLFAMSGSLLDRPIVFAVIKSGRFLTAIRSSEHCLAVARALIDRGNFKTWIWRSGFPAMPATFAPQGNASPSWMLDQKRDNIWSEMVRREN